MMPFDYVLNVDCVAQNCVIPFNAYLVKNKTRDLHKQPFHLFRLFFIVNFLYEFAYYTETAYCIIQFIILSNVTILKTFFFKFFRFVGTFFYIWKNALSADSIIIIKLLLSIYWKLWKDCILATKFTFHMKINLFVNILTLFIYFYFCFYFCLFYFWNQNNLKNLPSMKIEKLTIWIFTPCLLQIENL